MKAVMVKVMTKERTCGGVKYPAKDTEYSCEVLRNKSISIFKDGQLCNILHVGEEAEYDSYNLSYTGTITGITDKTVSIVAYKGTGAEKMKCLDLYAFCWRNYDFDAEETAKKNFEEMQYI